MGARLPRAAVVALAVSVALVLQVSVFSHLAWRGVVPSLVLLVVVGAAIAHGTEFAMVVGVAAGLLLDLAPPAEHVAGRWALALLVVGYVAGRMRGSDRPSLPAVVGTALACSFVGTSVFALSGMVLGETALGVPPLLEVLAVGLVWDAAAAPLVVPLVLSLFAKAEPDRVWARRLA